MGQLLAPSIWCRQGWCRGDAAAEHHWGDGCSCDAHGEELSGEPRRVVLTAKAARLSPFFCKACGGSCREMVEFPTGFFRCEPCASADRWPAPSPGAARRP